MPKGMGYSNKGMSMGRGSVRNKSTVDKDMGSSAGAAMHNKSGRGAKKKKSVTSMGPSMPGAKGMKVNTKTFTQEFTANDGGCQLGHNPSPHLSY